MQIIKREFTDSNLYNESAIGWHLEYSMLGQQHFKIVLNMFVDDDFSLARATLDGKLVHYGYSPIYSVLRRCLSILWYFKKKLVFFLLRFRYI